MYSLLLLSMMITADAPAPQVKSSPKPAVRVMPAGKLPPDERLEKIRTLHDPYHPWTPPKSLSEWEKRFRTVRTQLKVANGLWPMPKKTPLNPVIHGKIDRDDYTIEKVYFQSYPGHYVTGNLYRPKFRSGKLPAILSPHGHWKDGRFYDAGEKGAAEQIEQQAERFEPNARYPLQARMASLARMGCVVFHYDMVGYADSTRIEHRPEFNDAQSILMLQSTMGLQTYNSIRALDFLLSLEDVDPERIGVTGASGGGTQTFILCALDDRPAVAFPAVMVSTAMQGGCTCENAPLLRVGTGNVEFAAMFAPKPCAMSGADDWTIDIETKGLPELRTLYSLFRVPHDVSATCYPHFKHNYNQVSREMMYAWMNRHLGLGVDNVQERPIDPVPPQELSVFDAEHPTPEDAKSLEQLRQYWTEQAQQWLANFRPKDRPTFLKFRRTIKQALEAMVVDTMPEPSELQVTTINSVRWRDGVTHTLLIGRKPKPLLFPKEAIPTVVLMPKNWNGSMVVWIDERGHAGLWDEKAGTSELGLRPEVDQLLAGGTAVLSADVFLTGEYHPSEGKTPPPAVEEKYAGYTYCYNRTVMANRTHDVLTAIGCARSLYPATSVDLVGTGAAGPWVLLAKAIAGDSVRRTVADFHRFSFANVTDVASEDILPGGLKYGDLIGLAPLAAPGPLYAMGTSGYPEAAVKQLSAEYASAGNPEALTIAPDQTPLSEAINWLLK